MQKPDAEVATHSHISPVYSVQLQYQEDTKNERVFASGGIAGQLIVTRRGWIVQNEITIHEGEGPVNSIRWNGPLITWANDWGIKV